MKKMILVLFTLACINTSMAQTIEQKEDTQQDEITKEKKKKKKGSFWNKVKKGVESTTGLDVSKETLFVYPKMGEWKMQLISAKANSETGELAVVFGVMSLGGQKRGTLKMDEIIDGNNRTLEPGDEWKHGSNGYDLKAGTYTEFKLRPIYVKKGMKFLKAIKFVMDSNDYGFEARDIPITWIEKTE